MYIYRSMSTTTFENKYHQLSALREKLNRRLNICSTIVSKVSHGQELTPSEEKTLDEIKEVEAQIEKIQDYLTKLEVEHEKIKKKTEKTREEKNAISEWEKLYEEQHQVHNFFR
jgi:hypothetical protein